MDQVLQAHAVCSVSSDSLVVHLATVLESMKQVGLAASLKKCAAGWRELQCLGRHPKTKKQLVR